MRIVIVGTGNVGLTLALALQQIGHDVVVGTRDLCEAGVRSGGGWWSGCCESSAGETS